MPRRFDRSFWTNDLPIIGVLLALGLPICWLFTYSGPYAWLANLETRLTGGRVDPGIIVLLLIVALVLCVQCVARLLDRVLPKDPAASVPAPEPSNAPAPASATTDTPHDTRPTGAQNHRPHKKGHHHPAAGSHDAVSPPSHHTTVRTRHRGRRGSNWYIVALIAAIATAIFLVMSAFNAIVASTRGDLTTTTAAALESGVAPASRWVDVSGVAVTRGSVEISHSGRGRSWSVWYVPVIPPGRDPAGHATVFLSIDDQHHRQFTATTMPAFRGTVSLTSLPNDVKARFAERGLQVDSTHIVINFGESPSELLGNAKAMARIAAISWAIASIRSRGSR
jgi:hypothetical protein